MISITTRIKGTLSVLLVILSVTALMVTASCGGEKKKPNILLITMDTTRPDHLGVYGYPRQTSPFIDQLAQKGVVFEKTITPLPLTAGSHTSILTALHPLTHNVILNGDKLNDNVETIAEVFKANGYHTIGLVSYKVMTKKQGFHQGFDYFSDSWDLKTRYNHEFSRVGESVNQDLIKQIDNHCAQNKEQPFFIWVHYYDPHHPYFDRKYITFETDHKIPQYSDDVNKQVEFYDKEIRYMDNHIRALYAHLEAKGLTKNLVACLTADHGEQFGEHGFTFGHPDFYSETSYVPLIFHGRGIPERVRVKEQVSTMDIAPTLLKRAGLAFTLPTEGIDLVGAVEDGTPPKQRKFLLIGNPVYTRSIQLIDKDFAFILNFDPHYKHWYVDTEGKLNIEENRFKPINNLLPENYKAKLRFPKSFAKGKNYMVIRVNVTNGDVLNMMMRLIPSTYKDRHTLKTAAKNDVKTMDIVYPMTMMDGLITFLEAGEKTLLENIRYTLIERTEAEKMGLETVTGMRTEIFDHFLTPRKKSPHNELFHLADDFPMEKNLNHLPRHKQLTIENQKLIYDTYQYYYQKGINILKGIKDPDELSKKDIEMLKTLGYL